jgi:hypothetical protein
VHRLAGWLAGAAFVVPALLVATSSPAAAATTPTPAENAAGFLARQLTGPGNDHYVFSFDGTTPDNGLTADGVLSMVAAGTQTAARAKATAWLQQDGHNYVADFDDPKQFAPGQLAKLALVAEATGFDPDRFAAHVRLIHQLKLLECPATGAKPCSSTQAGEFKNTTKDGGFPSVLTQSLAVLALARSGQGPDRHAVSFLLAQQCASGGFPAAFRTAGHTCVGDVDTTGFALQSLTAASCAARDSHVRAAVAWLLSQQQADGGFKGAGTGAENANSTALALLGLAAVDQTSAGATNYLLNLQVPQTATPPAIPGAINLDTPFDPAHPEAFNADTALRATGQATQALTGISYADVAVPGVAALRAPASACTAIVPSRPSPTPVPQPRPRTAAVSRPATAVPTLPNTGAPEVPGTLLVGASTLLLGIGLRLVGRRRARTL